jgi:predicted enzyme related to lactoylglutathione lyase
MTDSESIFPKANNVELFAGSHVSDYETALAWYEKLFGCPPAYIASDTEAVWQLAEHRSLFIEKSADKVGGAVHSIFIDDFDSFIEQAIERGMKPAKREEYSNGVRKAIYFDPDGNEISFGGAPS